MTVKTSKGKKKVVRVNLITDSKVTDPKEFDNTGKYDRITQGKRKR
ncbi:MAG: hypothetical protein IJV22_07080 [Bacteroidales bacterium]|nr:hypothetical protein [Bacteroidales bacterium]